MKIGQCISNVTENFCIQCWSAGVSWLAGRFPKNSQLSRTSGLTRVTWLTVRPPDTYEHQKALAASLQFLSEACTVCWYARLKSSNEYLHNLLMILYTWNYFAKEPGGLTRVSKGRILENLCKAGLVQHILTKISKSFCTGIELGNVRTQKSKSFLHKTKLVT